jgi:type IV secretory pathway TrbL component
MEWMDPMSWRLPSGKALAEFALQAGFLAPLMLNPAGVRRIKKVAPVKPATAVTPGAPESSAMAGPAMGSQALSSQVVGSQAMRSQVGEEPEHSGTFRDGGGFGEGGFRESGFRK